MPKIALNTLRRIIHEELRILREDEDRTAAAENQKVIAKLLSALDDFEESASEKMKAEVSSDIEQLKGSLKTMFDSPMKYVDVTTPPGVDDASDIDVSGGSKASSSPGEKKMTLKTSKSSEEPDLM